MKQQFLFLIVSIIILSSFNTGLGHEGHTGFPLSYTVTASNETPNVWYQDADNIFSYQIANASQLFFTLNNESDPDTLIDITIGKKLENGTLTGLPFELSQIGDDEIQDALALGYWEMSHSFGLLADTNWSNTTSTANQITTATITVLTDLEGTYLGGTVKTVNVTIESGFQDTELVYEQNSGILVYGHSSFIGYDLEIIISSANADIEYWKDQDTNSSTTSEAFLPIFGMFIAVLTLHKIKKLNY